MFSSFLSTSFFPFLFLHVDISSAILLVIIFSRISVFSFGCRGGAVFNGVQSAKGLHVLTSCSSSIFFCLSPRVHVTLPYFTTGINDIFNNSKYVILDRNFRVNLLKYKVFFANNFLVVQIICYRPYRYTE